MNFTKLILSRFLQLNHQRKSLINELESALEQEQQQQEQEQQEQEHSAQSSCRNQADGEYIQQVITISTTAFLEIKEEVKLLVQMLQADLGRQDLASLMERIETLETQNIAECLQQNLTRRKAHVEQRDYTQRIATHQEKIDSLAQASIDLSAELRAELADLAES